VFPGGGCQEFADKGRLRVVSVLRLCH
jgi:hypothetical protein